MKQDEESLEVHGTAGSIRRIVVVDNVSTRPDIRGRRLQSPPTIQTTGAPALRSPGKLPPIRMPYLVVGVGAGVLLLTLTAWFALRKPAGGPTPATQESPKTENETGPKLEVAPQTQADDLGRIEEDAKQVIRRISRDDKPYSFSEGVVIEIRARVLALSRSPHMSGSLLKLQEQTASIGSKASKEGLQPSLVILLALALTKGGQDGDCQNAATRALPLLASLNKTFGSVDADGSLLLIAAFREGAGTHRSHPLLRRMNKVVDNPLTERNVWYLHDQDVLASDAYDLVLDTIAYGVIARNPRQFGLDNDPLSL